METHAATSSPMGVGLSRHQISRLLLILLALGMGLALLAALVLAAASQDWLGGSLGRQVRLEWRRFNFNRLYAMADPPFEQTPNAFLVRTVENMRPGTALEIAAGQGRNAVYLAQIGWDVTAFDISDKGLDIARQTAIRDGVHLNTLRQNAREFQYGQERWDLVVLVYAPIAYHDPALMQRIRDSVKPGGYVLVDTPITLGDAEPPRRASGDLLRGELPKIFAGFEVVSYAETKEPAEWYEKEMLIGRLLARKPSPRHVRR